MLSFPGKVKIQRAESVSRSTTFIDMGNLADTIAVVPDVLTESGVSEPLWDQMSDADLLDAWNQDQLQAALAELINRYSVMVLSVCRRGCRGEADAEDAFQSTFLYLSRNSKNIRQPERLPGWLHRVAQRAAIATWESLRFHTHLMTDPPDTIEDPLDQLTHRHESLVLDEELADLPEHYRAVLVLHHYEAKSVAHLSQHFGTTVGSIRGRLQRGKRMLAQRLRKRGLVPVVAWASLSMGSAPRSEAAEATARLLEEMAGGQLPDPPIDTSLLESLLLQGSTMTSFLSKCTVIAGCLALIGFLTWGEAGEGSRGGLNPANQKPVTLSFPSQALAQRIGGNARLSSAPGSSVPGGALMPGMDMGMGRMGGAGNASVPSSPGSSVPGGAKMGMGELVDLWQVDSKTAEGARKAMDVSYKFDIDVPLSGLPTALSDLTGQPVLLNERAVMLAEQDLKAPIKYTRELMPLRAAMRQMLRPLQLKVNIENDGMVIAADHAALARKGIGTDAWINIDEEVEREFSVKLDQKGDFEFYDAPLAECIKSWADKYMLKMVVDRRSLEDVGLSVDDPITLKLDNTTLRDALGMICDEFDLTYTIRGELIVLMSLEEAEYQGLVKRVYWLDGSGLDVQMAMDTVQKTINPETWEDIGGPSVIAPVVNQRQSLVINTTYVVHKEIEQLMKALRGGHLSEDPDIGLVRRKMKRDGGMGMGGMGMGGMGGSFNVIPDEGSLEGKKTSSPMQ